MQILTVELENVKSYEKATVTFSEGVNAIVGHNGAGKSTILEAIGFCLFDALDYNQNEFIRGGAKSARARVSFVSNADDRIYDVERRIGTGATYLVHDPQLGAKLCDGKADVLRFLRQHLDIEPAADLPSIFKDAVGVPQGTLTASFLLNDSNRKRVFESLLRVEEYTRVSDKLREPLNLLRARRAEVDVEISRLEGRLERLPILESEIAERKKLLHEAETALGQAMKELDAVQVTRAKLEQRRDELLSVERSLSDVQRNLQGIEASYHAAHQAQSDAEAAQKVVTENQAGHSAYLEAESQQEELDGRVRQRQEIEAKRSNADKEVALLEARAKNLQRELAEVGEANKLMLELHPLVTKQVELEGNLALSRQRLALLEEAKRNVALQLAEFERLQSRRADVERQLAEAREVEMNIQVASEHSEAGRRKLEEGRNHLARLKSEADLVKEQSQRLEDVQTTLCPLCEQPLTGSHRQEILARNNNRLQGMRSSYRDANMEVQALETSVQEAESSLTSYRAALMKLPRMDEAAKLDEEVARKQVTFDQATAQSETLGGAAAEMEQASTALAELGDPRSRYALAEQQALRRTTLEAQVAETDGKVEASRKLLGEYQAQLTAFGDLEAQLDAVGAELQRYRVAFQAVLGNARQAEALAARVQATERLGGEMAVLQKKSSELMQAYQYAGKDFDAEAYAQASQREQELQREVGTLKGNRSSMQASQERAERELSDLRQLTAAVSEAVASKNRIVHQEEILSTIREKLKQAGPYISAALNRQISDGARQIFGDLMQDYTRHLTWNDDYSITLEVDGRQRSFSQLSGGEQMTAALSVRLALLREMSSIDVAFFDEPTANLDEGRRESLARQILGVRGFKQLFVISHDDTFEQATQNLIRVERFEGTSRIVPA